jgi:hypothetical protein
MFRACFSHEARFRQVIDKQLKLTSILKFICTKNEISAVSYSPSRGIAHLQFPSECLKDYVHPAEKGKGNEVVQFIVETSELSEKMTDSKENLNNSIVLTLENIEKTKELRLDFINENGEKTIPSKTVTLLDGAPKYSTSTMMTTMFDLPDLSEASTLTTDSEELKRIFMSESVLSNHVEITMTKKKVVFAIVKTGAGYGEYIAYHNDVSCVGNTDDNNSDDDEAKQKEYSEDDIYQQCPKYLAVKNIIDFKEQKKENGEGEGGQRQESIKQCFKLTTLALCEKPTTYSNRVVMGMTPNKSIFIRYKIFNSGFATYYINPSELKNLTS